jgi:nucleoside-diphosphate-sugar epimerase
VTGAGGFIGHHLVNHLKRQGLWVRGVDIQNPEFGSSRADEFVLADLRDPSNRRRAVEGVEEVYDLVADMGESSVRVAE